MTTSLKKGMKPSDKKILLDFYEGLYSCYGANFLGSGWPNLEDQLKRFQILTEIGDMNEKSILDVGCGFGDLYLYLKEKYEDFSYTGIDISEKIIKAAKKKFPEVDFRVHDLIENKLERNFDYVFLSGVFNPKLSDNWYFIKAMIEKMFTICNCGIAFNMFSNKVDFMDDKIHYQNREQLREYLRTLTDKITERDEYMRFEFTVYLYRK
jgi:trans-aconitate methyltransferase